MCPKIQSNQSSCVNKKAPKKTEQPTLAKPAAAPWQEIRYNPGTDMYEADTKYSEAKAKELGVAVSNLVDAWFGSSPKK